MHTQIDIPMYIYPHRHTQTCMLWRMSDVIWPAAWLRWNASSSCNMSSSSKIVALYGYLQQTDMIRAKGRFETHTYSAQKYIYRQTYIYLSIHLSFYLSIDLQIRNRYRYLISRHSRYASGYIPMGTIHQCLYTYGYANTPMSIYPWLLPIYL